jgi:hypothetical protein
MHNITFKFFISCHRLVRGLANRILDKNQIRPRNFSNMMLRRYAPYFTGSVINVSGWQDGDGEGGKYQSYFSRATSYAVSNVGGQKKGFGSAPSGYEELELDLTSEVESGIYDVVFNHTTLEHIYNFKKAFDNLCKLSREVVIVVVPVLQQIHHTEDFGDYWRPTTLTIAKMFRDNGLEPLVLQCNDQPFAPVYCFAIAVRNRDKHLELKKSINFEMGKYNYGSSLKKEFINNFL